MNKPRKPFTFKQFTIHQNNASLPVTTDACLLGAIAQFENPKNILDMGTGTGLLLHFMSQKYPNATLTGIDIHSDSIECAKSNLELNHIAHKTTLINGNFFDPNVSYLNTQFDAIISNPPFFENQLKSVDLVKSKARHFDNGDMFQFFDQIDRLLSLNGTAYIMTPPTVNYSELTQKLFPRKTTLVFDSLNKSAHIQIVELTRKKENASIEKIFIRESNKSYTKEFCHIMTPYYLDRALFANHN